MVRWLIRITAVLLLAFMGIVLAVRLQQYDDDELRSVLLPKGCPMPCFMGIQPGITTMDEARAILTHHAWVGEIRERVGTIEWTWSAVSPSVIDRRYAGYVQHSNMPDELCCVGSVKFSSAFTLGDLYLLLGEPPRTNLIRGATRTYALVSLSYVNQNIRLFTTIDCPLDHMAFWQTRLETYIESPTLYKQESGVSAPLVC